MLGPFESWVQLATWEDPRFQLELIMAAFTGWLGILLMKSGYMGMLYRAAFGTRETRRKAQEFIVPDLSSEPSEPEVAPPPIPPPGLP